MHPDMYIDRADAGRRLGAILAGVALRDPIVLAIPRGGVEVGAAIAATIGAELDIVLSRKLRAPCQPELALGAVAEGGEIHVDRAIVAAAGADDADLERERAFQLREIERRSRIFRAVRPRAPVSGRSVILTDDGMATGSTMIAALRTVQAAGALERIVAVPVAARACLDAIRPLCDRVVCPLAPSSFMSIGQFYGHFDQVPDERVLEHLREAMRATATRAARPS